MFYPVRIFNSEGALKRELSTEQLSRQYWKRFFDKENRLKPPSVAKKKKQEKRRFQWKFWKPKAEPGGPR